MSKRCTKVDWAREMAALLDDTYVKCLRITLVCDNLNVHTKGAFYEAFDAATTCDYVKRIEWYFTLKHGN